jgi:glycosyltransferase involved in cell wall biosynthesis
MRNLRVLMYALHSDPRHFVGGGFIRAMQLLRHAKTAGIEYHVVETGPRFKDVYRDLDYDGVALPVSNPQTIGSGMARVVVSALRAGVREARKNDVDLVYSPVEVHPSAFLPYMTHLLTGKPWTMMLNSIPLYGPIPDGTDPGRVQGGSSVADLNSYLRNRRRFGLGSSLAGAFGYNLIYGMLERCRLPLAVSQVVTEDLSKVDRRAKAPYVVVPGNGVAKSPSWSHDPSLGSLDGVVIASYAPEKGLLESIGIWARVVRRMPRAVLGITGFLGRYGEGSRRRLSELTSLVEDLGLHSNVVYMNELLTGVDHDQLLSNISRGRVLLSPSTFETWGMTVGEALSVGVPVVAYDTRAIKFAYGRCVAIRLVKAHDKDNFATEVLALLSRQNSAIQATARSCVEGLTWEKVVRAERDAYINCVRLA